ncbi:MAG: hypothetical protein ACMXYM_01760 [Candidatus Woesearchaeota archaeon]
MHPFRCSVCNRLTLPVSRFMFYDEPVCQTCMKVEGLWTTK